MGNFLVSETLGNDSKVLYKINHWQGLAKTTKNILLLSETRSGRSLANTFPFSQVSGPSQFQSSNSYFSQYSDQSPLLVQNPYRARGASLQSYGQQQVSLSLEILSSRYTTYLFCYSNSYWKISWLNQHYLLFLFGTQETFLVQTCIGTV